MIRRFILAFGLLAAFAAMPMARAAKAPSDMIDIAGLVPPLAFRMQDVNSGRAVTAADFRGKVVLLFFGYSNCGDECPFTQYRIQQVFHHLGKAADRAVFLFVTVDPKRDTPPVLRHYVGLFGRHMIGLRGSPNALYDLARRYRVVFSVSPSPNPQDYTVTHSAAVYVFGPGGQARYMIQRLGIAKHPPIGAIAATLRGLILDPPKKPLLDTLAGLG